MILAYANTKILTQPLAAKLHALVQGLQLILAQTSLPQGLIMEVDALNIITHLYE